jgi:hypothetical protein
MTLAIRDRDTGQVWSQPDAAGHRDILREAARQLGIGAVALAARIECGYVMNGRFIPTRKSEKW